MRLGETVVLFGDENGEGVEAVEAALDGASVRVVGTAAAAAAALDAAAGAVVTDVARARELLDAVGGDPPVPVVVLTADGAAPLAAHEGVRHHRASDLATLASRVGDAVAADRERRRDADDGRREEDGPITDRQAAYRTLVGNVPDGGVSLFDRDLRYIWAGGEVFEQVDLDRESVEGRLVEEVHPPEFVSAHADAYRAVFDGERSTFEFDYLGRTFRSTVVPVVDDERVVAGMTLTRDVTDQVERRRDLRVKTRAMDAAAIGLCLTDPDRPDNPLVYVNEGYERMTGYDADELLGRNPRVLQGPETEAAPRERMREAVAATEPCAVDVTNYRKDGTPFVNHVEITPIFDEAGDLIHFLGSQVDVTEQYERRRALERQNEQLERFTSIVSHDLRNPLAVAAGSVDLARRTGDRSHLDRAESALDRTSTLVDDLLALAREGKRLDPEGIEPVSLAAVARGAWDDVDTTGARLSVVDDRELLADESRLRQLFENLFRNAVEHGSTSPRSNPRGDADEHGSTSPRSGAHESADPREAGDDERTAAGEEFRRGAADLSPGDATTADRGVEVRVGTLPTGDGFYVADDGRGLPESVHDSLFEAGVTTADPGTGFGLAIVRTVAEAHGWTVVATDSATGGARFEFEVPPRDGDDVTGDRD